MEGEETFGYPAAGAHGQVDTESLVMPYLGAFAQFREDVRKVAKQQKGTMKNLNVNFSLLKR